MIGDLCDACGTRLPTWVPSDHECSTTDSRSPAFDPTVGRCAEPGYFVHDGDLYRSLRDPALRGGA